MPELRYIFGFAALFRILGYLVIQMVHSCRGEQQYFRLSKGVNNAVRWLLLYGQMHIVRSLERLPM